MNKPIYFFAPLARMILALIFVMSGINKITQYSGTQSYMDFMGVPSFILPLVIVIEIIGGLAIVFGYKTKLAALTLAGFSLLSAILLHADFASQADILSFITNIAIAGGFIMLFIYGPGGIAIDNSNRKPQSPIGNTTLA